VKLEGFAVILVFSLMFFMLGCVGQGQQNANESICPEGFHLINGTCVPSENQSKVILTLSPGQEFSISDNNFILDNILYDSSIRNGTCVLNDITAIIKKKINETSSETYSIDLNGQLQLGDRSITFSALNYSSFIKSGECKAKNIDVTFSVKTPEYDKDSFTLGLDDTHDLPSGDELSVDSIKYSSNFDDSIDLTISLDENEDSHISSDLRIVYLDTIVQTERGDEQEVNITRGEGQMASLPGDYSLEITSIDMTVNPPDSNIETNNYEKGNSTTFSDDTTMQVDDIIINMTNCSDTCSIINKTVRLKVRPEGTGSYEYYNLSEGDTINASALIVIEIVSIDADTYCYNNTETNETECRYENATVELRETTYNEHCSVSDKHIDVRLIRPDTSDETATLDYGERKEFLTNEVIEALSITGDLSDSYGGMCNLTNKKATLYIKVPSTSYSLSSAKAKLKIIYKGDEFVKTLGKDQSVEIGNGINISIDELDVSLDEDGKVSDASAKIHITAPKRCRDVGAEATLRYSDNNKINVKEGDEFTINGLNYDVDSITATVTPGEDSCKVTNKKIKLNEYIPVIKNISLNIGENKTIGDLLLGLSEANIDVSKDTNKNCILGDKGIKIFLISGGAEKDIDANEGDVYSIGDYEVTVEQINADIPSKAKDSCEINDLSATFELQ